VASIVRFGIHITFKKLIKDFKMNLLKIVLSVFAYLVYLMSPAVIMACSSCNVKYAYTQKQLDAYFGTTFLMAILPVSFAGLLVYAVYKSAKSQNQN